MIRLEAQNMSELRTYTLNEIRLALSSGRFPLTGITPLGSAEFQILKPDPVLGVALHTGSRIRPEVEELLAIGEEDRFREEDPYTEYFLKDFPVKLIARDSRFEYDLNWEIEKTVYEADRQKWGMKVWKVSPGKELLERTYEKYREFHALMDLILGFLLTRFPQLFLFDMHSYCYQRESKASWWEDPRPEINLGTRSVNREHFRAQIDTFLSGVSGMELDGYPLRVGENEVFPGGYLTRKYAQMFNREVLVLAIEYKKIFMDEWSGELYPDRLRMLTENLLLTKERVVQTNV